MKLAILLTASVNPQCLGAQLTATERADMYRDTLNNYARTVGRDYPVVFVENTGYDLSAFDCEFAAVMRVEWLQIAGNDIGEEHPLTSDNTKGKGWNEYRMISEAVKRSKTLHEATHFLKITGRYPMYNVRAIISEAECRCRGKVFMADVQDTRLYDILGRRGMGHVGESRFWVAETEWWGHEMMTFYEGIDEAHGRIVEHCILELARNHRHDSRFVWRFRRQVRFGGLATLRSSADLAAGRGRHDAPLARIKDALHQVLRYILPQWWF